MSDLNTLLEMGFDLVRARIALQRTDYSGVLPAMEWLLAHSEEIIISDEDADDDLYARSDLGDSLLDDGDTESFSLSSDEDERQSRKRRIKEKYADEEKKDMGSEAARTKCVIDKKDANSHNIYDTGKASNGHVEGANSSDLKEGGAVALIVTSGETYEVVAKEKTDCQEKTHKERTEADDVIEVKEKLETRVPRGSCSPEGSSKEH